MTYATSITNYVNNLILKSIQLAASDIHLESYKTGLKIRLRIDGILYDEEFIDKEYALQIISHIKVLAYLNLSERRIPQDGKVNYSIDNEVNVDLRVSSFPSIYGEKIVIRILDGRLNKLNLDSLGLSSSLLDTIKKIAQSLNGFFLVTGPTGSGKTTTLHAMISFINNAEKNICTLEDPVEYNIEGITQSQIFPEIGFTFDKGIRALLRQDPDVIMVGEIRDIETAKVAIQASLTGHLVLSTLHTNDAPGALMRLLDMQIEPFLINATLTGILAQRLIRKLCEFCKYKAGITQDEKAFLDTKKVEVENLYKSKGCKECNNSGYKGRTGIFELMQISQSLRHIVTSQPIFKNIQDQAYSDGMVPLLNDAIEKVNLGITSLGEIIRVLF